MNSEMDRPVPPDHGGWDHIILADPLQDRLRVVDAFQCGIGPLEDGGHTLRTMPHTLALNDFHWMQICKSIGVAFLPEDPKPHEGHLARSEGRTLRAESRYVKINESGWKWWTLTAMGEKYRERHAERPAIDIDGIHELQVRFRETADFRKPDQFLEYLRMLADAADWDLTEAREKREAARRRAEMRLERE